MDARLLRGAAGSAVMKDDEGTFSALSQDVFWLAGGTYGLPPRPDCAAGSPAARRSSGCQAHGLQTGRHTASALANSEPAPPTLGLTLVNPRLRPFLRLSRRRHSLLRRQQPRAHQPVHLVLLLQHLPLLIRRHIIPLLLHATLLSRGGVGDPELPTLGLPLVRLPTGGVELVDLGLNLLDESLALVPDDFVTVRLDTIQRDEHLRQRIIQLEHRPVDRVKAELRTRHRGSGLEV